MSLTTTLSRKNYQGNGVTKAFAIPFKFLSNSHISVSIINAEGAITLLTQGVDYTLSGAGSGSGGTATLVVAPLATETAIITRYVPALQLNSYRATGRFSEEQIEDDLDYLTMLAQQAEQGIDDPAGAALQSLVVKYPLNEPDTTSPELPVKASRLSKIAGWDADGDWTAVDLSSDAIGGLTGPASQVEDNIALYDATQGVLKQDNDLAASRFKQQTLIYSATITWDSSAGHYASLTLGGSPTVNVTNQKSGPYYLTLTQDATGGRLITWGVMFEGADTLQINTTPNAVTTIQFFSDGTKLYPVTSSAGSVATSGAVGTFREYAYDITGIEDTVGALIANGQAVSETKYARLYAVIGHDYDTCAETWDGTTFTNFSAPSAGYFRVPNLLIAGAGALTGQTFGLFKRGALAGNIGDVQTDTTAVNGLTPGVTDPGHQHTFTDDDQGVVTTSPVGTGPGTVNVDFAPATDITDSATTGISVSLTGDTETRPLNIGVQPAIVF